MPGYRRPLAALDCETDPFRRHRIPQPFIWGFYDGGFLDPEKPFYYFNDNDSLIEFLRDKEFIVYAHNGGRFDYHYLLQYIETFDYVTLISGRLAKFNIGISEFRDSYNIIPVPLAAYEKMEFDYSLLEKENRDKPENRAKILEYLESDCKNLYDMVAAFRERYGVQLTQAGAAMKQWEKIHGARAPRSTAEFYTAFKPYYYGGRCECFQVGVIDEPFKVVDINSAYPYAMLQAHPYGLEYSTFSGGAATLDDMENAEIGAAFFTVECVSLGAFPFRDVDGSLWFPNDAQQRTYNVTGWEVLAALETQTIHDAKILRVHSFDDCVSFAPYVQHFYAERLRAKENGDRAGDLFAKLFLNSLYGKFGACPENYAEYYVTGIEHVGALSPDNRAEWIEIEGRPWSFAGFLGPHALARSPLPENRQRFYNVATAASITGYTRALLWRALCASEGVLYCDTDSMAAVTPRVPLGPDLGAWEVEGEFTRAAIAGKKLYAFRYTDATRPKKLGRKIRWKTASKGVKLTPSQIMKVAKGGTVNYTPEVPTYSVKGSVDPVTGERVVARFISRQVSMLAKNTERLKR